MAIPQISHSLLEIEGTSSLDLESPQVPKTHSHVIPRNEKKKRRKPSAHKMTLVASQKDEYGSVEESESQIQSDVPVANTWTSTEWGKCQTNCGPGYQYRILSCVDPNGSVIDDSQCDADSKPADRQPCEGDCLSCEITGKFFSRIGVAGVPLSPVEINTPDNSMCAVVQSENVDSTCCTANVESNIQVMYAQLQFGMKAQALHRDRSIERIQDLYANITNHLNDRMSETDDAVSTLQDLMDQSSIDIKSPENAQKLQGLRQLLLEAMNMRSVALDQALSDFGSAQDSFIQQLDLMNSSEEDMNPSDSTDSVASSLFAEFDPSSSFLSRSQIHFDTKNPSPAAAAHAKAESSFSQTKDDSSDTATSFNATSILTALKDPNVRVVSKSCEIAISNYFQDLACGACNPSFPINNQQPPRTPVVSIPVSNCDNLYSQCADSLGAAHQNMFAGAQALGNSQAELMTVATQLDTVLNAVWSEMRFDWIPGFAPSLMASPSLASMGCMQNLDVFQPMALNTSADFCHNYFSFASPRAFIKRLSVQLDRGVLAAHKFAKCDKCVHETAMFLSEILGSTNRASLRITLPTKTKAMLLACGRSSNPIKTAITKSPIELPVEFAKMNTFERMSPRVLFSNDITPLKSLNQYAVANRGVFSALGATPAYEWKMRSLINSTSNKPTTTNGSENSFHRQTPDDMIRFNVMNMNCTKHSDCFNQGSRSGLRPWWFCAHPNACIEQPGACDADGALLLSTGPKCVSGPCTDDLSAIDKVCPDNAVCPTDGGATTDANPSPYFGLEYFARFDLKTRGIDPVDVSATKGVCDCALGDNGEIVDPCEYARCLAYASLMETHTTCSTNLVKQCLAIKETDQCKNDVTLDCTNKDLILVYPPENPGECPVNQMALQSESNGIETISLSVWMRLFVVSTTIAMIL